MTGRSELSGTDAGGRAIAAGDDVIDVLVIGGGMAGVAALLSATEDGSRALLLEKTNALGGSTVMSAGLLAFAGTDEQRAGGITDSVDDLRRDLLETGGHRSSIELLERYCSDQLATYRWLAECGVIFGRPVAGSGQSIARSHPIDTTAAIDSLSRRALDRGAQIRYNVRADRLIVENERVVGAQVIDDERRTEIRAGAVMLATGGFSRNQQLLSRFAPNMERALRGGAAGSTGDGLLMGCKVGAGLIDTPYIKGTFGIFPWPSVHEEGTGILPVYKGAIAVNGFGSRFVNESIPYKEIGDACLAQPEALAYQIFDATVLAAADPDVAIYDFDKRVAAGHVQQAGTIGELAELLGLPRDVLEETVFEYNRRLQAGSADEFGRTTLSGGIGQATPLLVAPFYGYPSTAVVLATYCGLAVDASARVLDVFNEPIPGLYAAGELTGGFHGAGYVTGTSIGKAAVFGRVAGHAAALEAKGRQ